MARFRLKAIDNDKFGAPNYCGQLLDTIDAEHKASKLKILNCGNIQSPYDPMKVTA